MERKVYRAPIALKANSDETGEFRAEFATLNVVDHDGDVTVPGAFRVGQEAIIEAWNHGYDKLPVGMGVIREEGDKAVVDGRFFLDTSSGLEHYKVVKALGPLAEWSYTFNILDSKLGTFEQDSEKRRVRFLRKLDVWGVAPVQRGAGIDTGTVYVKGAKGALASHSTPTTDAAWDGPANEARARSGENEAYYRRIYAWRDPDGDPSVKSSYKFPHHMVDGSGNPGAANIRACQSGIGVLNGGRGGTTIPSADRQGVYNHLARHLRDADVEPPELKSLSEIAEKGEGQTADSGEPSGPTPQVVLAEIEIEMLEGE